MEIKSAASPHAGNERGRWLRELVRLGEQAREALSREEPRNENRTPRLAWDNIWNSFRERTLRPLPQASIPSYIRWFAILAERAETPPDELSFEDARRIASALYAQYVSARRMIGFFRRAWRTLCLDDSVWKRVREDFGDLRRCGSAALHEREYYRRLSVAEVRSVVSRLERAGRRAYADMVAIGFYTGLRLSDVAELELAEISDDRRFLVLRPNKVRHVKPRPIVIPLIEPVRRIVIRRIGEMRKCGTAGFLFPADARHRPSRKICAAFRACGILRQGEGRASFHSLRATFISMMDEAGVPPHVTDAITGHSGGGMHTRYSQPVPAALLAAVRRAFPPAKQLQPIGRTPRPPGPDSVSGPRKLGITNVGLGSGRKQKVNRSREQGRVAKQARVQKEKKMKKLMIVAAAAAMTFGAQAVVPCDDCGGSSTWNVTVVPSARDLTCQVAVFKVTGSGKAVVMAKNGEYSTVGALKIQKGALAIDGDYCAAAGACCYEDGTFYATLKAGSAKLKMSAPVEIPVWSLFGKNLAVLENVGKQKKGGKYTLDSGLFVTAADGEAWNDEESITDISFWASAFGKATFTVGKSNSSMCGDDECDITVLPKNYSGWFVAQYICVDMEYCFKCDCDGLDIAGGTWKAVFQAGKKTQAAAAKLAGVSIADED